MINEMLNSVTRFDYLPETGKLIERQTITTLPKDYNGTTHTADLKITPNGKFCTAQTAVTTAWLRIALPTTGSCR